LFSSFSCGKFILLLFFSQMIPLHHSGANSRLEVCRLLVESKADVAASDRCFIPPPLSPSFFHYLPCSFGESALKHAINKRKADVATSLRSIGAPQ
jgi:hypothetical protein